ncbi:hypothetical protein AMTRI_Chr02g254410 [Amborella trichopoda]|uniref:Glutaredoxin domain-containing protein n=1 Tax=Amborella trichopoda TaxID=13333 RepID=W1NVE7_AMBTC|nr:glutaredoxin-C1 [Amborella trichopoda]ERM99210.1 hypothetical protein AMTR_s00092p00109090 [Amborella trichopoda]|eukprot:XP_006836357.3 glutaredoxin-C1 [Amborella trichopoda]
MQLRLGSTEMDLGLSQGMDEWVQQVAGESAVVVFSDQGCCMCHVARSLFSSLGVSPAVHEIEEGWRGDEVRAALCRIAGGVEVALPAVFVGGRLVGGLERVVACHISGGLVPLLKEAGALWL